MEYFLISCASINCALMLSYFDGRLNVAPEELAAYKTKHTLRYLRFPEEKVEKITAQVMEIASMIDISAGKNFEVILNGEKIF